MARIDVPMPQMGESIAEGTVSKWLKQVGDSVKRDEPILEISTDKVDAEIPAPSEGVLVEILVSEGETVEVGTVVAYLDPDAEAGTGEQDTGQAPVEDADPGSVEDETGQASPAAAEVAGATAEGTAGAEASAEGAVELQADAEAAEDGTDGEGREEETAEHRLRTRSTPVVRKIAEEHHVELSQVQGTGHGGRVTKDDILAHLERADTDGAQASSSAPDAVREEPVQPEPKTPVQARPSVSAEVGAKEDEVGAKKDPVSPPAAAGGFGPSELWKTFYSRVQHPEFPVRPNDRVEAMDKIRRLTAEHMVLAKRVAPHVHSFIEIDFTRVDAIRRSNKARWADQGVKVSYTAFVAWACSRLLREFPQINGTVSGNNLIYRANVNVGVAVDLDPGLIVPVIHNADELSLVGVAKKIVDLAGRARSRRLNPDEIQGVTFSITNPGVLGTMVGMPIIPKGTAAILGTGAIEKRVVVVEDPDSGTDSIAIRKRTLFSLGYDHRIVDGADAARFLAQLKGLLETFPEDA